METRPPRDRSTWRLPAALAGAVIFFLLAQHLILAVMTSSSKIVVTARLDHADIMQLYFSNVPDRAAFNEKDSAISRPLSAGVKTEAVFRAGDAPVRKIRLDPGTRPGVAELYELQVFSHFAASRTFGPGDIMRLFVPGREDIELSLEGDHVRVVSRTDDPAIISSGPLLAVNALPSYLLAFILSVIFFFLLNRFDFAAQPAVRDILRKKPSLGANIDALDGLRGLAAIMVVAEHTYGRLNGIGITGVWIFMTLSGFLLARPFVLQQSRAVSLPFWEHFFSRRLKRILPLYYAYITVVYLLPGRFDRALRHYFFLQGDGVLWVINQEMAFYLLTPLIMIAVWLLCRNRSWPAIILLTVLLLVSYLYVGASVFSLYGMNHQQLRLYLNIFLAGVIFSYLYHGVFAPSSLFRRMDGRLRQVFSWLGIVILFWFLLGSTGRLWGKAMIWSIVHDQWFGIGAAMLIFCIVAAPGTALTKIMSWLPLRAVGLVSFSVYLLHPLVIRVIADGAERYYGYTLSDLPLFVCALVVTYGVSCLTYAHIERPFIRA